MGRRSGSELFWLEITDRDDIGVDLHAPQRDARGATSPGYSLVWWVNPGDVVFHYDRNAPAIASWSRAVGQVEEAPVVWRPHTALPADGDSAFPELNRVGGSIWTARIRSRSP